MTEQNVEKDATWACRHDDVRTFRSVPPHSKCVECGAVVERRWVSVSLASTPEEGPR